MTPIAARLATGLALLALAGCTSTQSHLSGVPDRGVPSGGIRLVAFDSCDDLLTGLRAAASAVVGPYGFGAGHTWEAMPATGGGARTDALRADKAVAPEPAAHSGTNNHEVGVDEPDLVKTDGRRIVTVSGGVLRVVDVASRTLTGSLDLTAASGADAVSPDITLLLAGDHALALLGGVPGDDDTPRLLLLDLAGRPRVLSSYATDGAIVDARQVGDVARVVLRSSPRLTFPERPNADVDERLRLNQEAVRKAPLDAWLPRYRVQTGDTVTQGQVDCHSVSRPASYAATSLLTVLTLDLRANSLGAGDPVTVVANGETVYATGSSLYVANEDRWRVTPMPLPEPIVGSALPRRPIVGSALPRRPIGDQRTELYKFDISGAGRPRFVAAGTVPGWLISQYALSEWNGDLRVALTTTLSPSPATDGRLEPSTESAVRVLRQDGAQLVERGSVTGLGKGERIFGVRFDGGTGYVVTFRQTDPLYTVDLRDPSAPRLAGELKINGYSAYLHPAGPGRLIGVGQDATDSGARTGTQVSLFDVSDLAQPTRLAQYAIRNGSSEAEFEPHAFLYQPATGLLVVPVRAPIAAPTDLRSPPTVGAVALTVRGATIAEIGRVSHPQVGPTSAKKRPTGAQIRRSIVIGTTLWTVSGAGVKANDTTTLADVDWIPFG